MVGRNEMARDDRATSSDDAVAKQLGRDDALGIERRGDAAATVRLGGVEWTRGR